MKNVRLSTQTLKQFTTSAALLMITLVTLQSCKKDRPSNEPSIEKSMKINFQAGAISIADVDSATVVLKKEGSATLFYRRLDKSASSLHMLMDDSPAGNWTAEIFIYTKKGTDNSSRMFTRSIGFKLPLASSLNITAPTGEINGVWKPHVVLASNNNDVVVVLAADNGDPYFDVRVKDSKWDYFYIERYAFNRTGGMNEQIEADAWECYNSCYTQDKVIINTTDFLDFANAVKTKTWNNGEIFVIVADIETQEERSFLYNYNK
ncbi:MAG TPA: hypothetical protein VGD17_03635 [Chitinophagaceae bacterium]